MVDDQRERRHFVLDGITTTERFARKGGGSTPSVPPRDRRSHAAALRERLAELRAVAEDNKLAQTDAGLVDGIGIQIEFRSFPDVDLLAERLARESRGIELQNVRKSAETGRTHATVFVPDGELDHFENIVRTYARTPVGRPRDNRLLVDAIEDLREATLRALWTDADDEFPADEDEELWWEVWLPVRGDRGAEAARFREHIGLLAVGSVTSRDVGGGASQADLFDRSTTSSGLRVAEGELHFPERTVLLVHATAQQLRHSMPVLNNIAELRRTKDAAEFFDALPVDEQTEWFEDLLARTTFAPPDANVPYVCLLDTGVNRGHPLLAHLLAQHDLHAVNPNFGTGDNYGHGTQMAGLATLGDLAPLLESADVVTVKHRLESVKLFDDVTSTGNCARHHGYITQEAVARAEVAAPHRARLFGMAVTAPEDRGRGQPSAWSAALDAVAADANGEEDGRRLVIISAGNSADSSRAHYPDGNDTDSIHDPAQAWNALVVGAYTELTDITEDDTDGYSPVAPRGGLSPFSTTSVTWQPQWPMKPDLVLEGGNVGQDDRGPVEMLSLSLLTTHHRPAERLLTTSNATSAAMALACRMGAQVAAEYPLLWPETIRALLVHAAEWTDAMEATYLPRHPSKESYERLIRRCGFGVPSLNRALYSAADSLTMVVQETLRPFGHNANQQLSLRDMHLHHLPWPTEALESLGELLVEMRITLSYFIEPNPSRRGQSQRYAYQSHGLRFDVRRPTETIDDFRRRVNASASSEDRGQPTRSNDPHWLLGTQRRHKGSLHGDIWRGTAADLASRDSIAVYPTSGWWKTRPALERYDLPAPYALVVSIRAPEANVDLYAEVANRVDALVEVT